MSLKRTILCFLFYIVLLASINGQRQGRIINGNNANKGQFPWHVDLYVNNKDNSFHVCGGTLISDTWVLTAAHCIQKASSIVISIGLTNRVNREYVTVADHFIAHESFDSDSHKNDIGLVHLHEALPKTENIRPVPLPTPEVSKQDLVGLTGFVSGFGKYSVNSDDMSSKLLWLDVLIVNRNECQKAFGSNYASNLCAIAIQPGQNICSGDNGGGLIVEIDRQMYVFGIALVTTSGCIGSPAIYENVVDQLKWIEDTIKREDH